MSTICSKLCSKLCSDNGREMTTEVTKLIRLNRLNSFNYVISRRRARRASFHATISLPVKDWGDDQLHHLSDAPNVTLKAYRPYRRKNAAVAALDCFVKSFQAATQAWMFLQCPLTDLAL